MPARLDFKAIAENTDIYEVAKYLGLTITKDRATCPVCDRERSLQFYAETNTFFCHSAQKGSDCISLVAHIKGYSGQYPAAKELAEQFAMPSGTQEVRTAPQKPQGRTEKSQPARAPEFDPAKFAAKLIYSEEVEALGITEAEAASVALGYHPQRKQLYFALRDEFGFTTGYVAVKGELKMPPKLLQNPNVVKLKRA